MPRRTLGHPVCTVHNGRRWINEVEGRGPYRGSFLSREAAVAVGRAHAADAGAVRMIYDLEGNVVESHSYERGTGSAA
jgi:hypothetical protein